VNVFWLMVAAMTTKRDEERNFRRLTDWSEELVVRRLGFGGFDAASIVQFGVFGKQRIT